MGQLRRERIAERMKALQELVPNGNKVNFYSIHFQFSFQKLRLVKILNGSL
jgi:hypothetical protein